MVTGVKAITKDWKYDVVSIGYPGVVRNNRILVNPFNLGKGWVGFSFRAAFRRPVRIVNDAVMQALGSYRGGTMLFSASAPGWAALVVNGHVVPMEIAHFPFGKLTIEDYLGTRRRREPRPGPVAEARRGGDGRAVAAFLVDDVVLGGKRQEARRLPKGLPPRRERQCVPRRTPALGGRAPNACSSATPPGVRP